MCGELKKTTLNKAAFLVFWGYKAAKSKASKP